MLLTDKQAQFKYTINASSQGKLYFYLDETWDYAYAETDCARRIAMAKFDSKAKLKGGFQYGNSGWSRTSNKGRG